MELSDNYMCNGQMTIMDFINDRNKNHNNSSDNAHNLHVSGNREKNNIGKEEKI